MRIAIYRRSFRWFPQEPDRWFTSLEAASNFGRNDDWRAPEKFLVTVSRVGLVKLLNKLEKNRG